MNRFILIFIITLAIGIFLYWKTGLNRQDVSVPEVGQEALFKEPLPEEDVKEDGSAPLFLAPPKAIVTEFGARFKVYGSDESLPNDDLQILQDALDSFHLLAKDPNIMPTSGNQALCEALCGSNRLKLQVLSKEYLPLNEEGELLDRWGSPLYFHFLSGTELSIRSAGPDKIMWNEDDIVQG